jgi:malonyl-CoA/methylmalonyl-CoA synthetase
MYSRQMAPPIVTRAARYGLKIAILDARGSHSHAELLEAAQTIASSLVGKNNDLQEARIAFEIAPSFEWVATLWGIWLAGGIAVPLPLGAPASELEYILNDTEASLWISNEALSSQKIQTSSVEELLHSNLSALPTITEDRRAMILYTSGTTSRPKGVVTTHANVTAQITTLIDAWEWNEKDRILLCLPLHHVHGIINVVSCAMWSGAVCEMLPRFDAATVWERLASGELTLFMAVPTIYFRLISAWEAASPEVKKRWSDGAATLRLMVSGSAALPVSTLEKWKAITGHTLLERYGMTEIGMALSNSYRGERIPGSVGRPLPHVDVRLVNESGEEVQPGTPGEIEVRGPSVFREYWRREDATREAFRDGWFRTGDTAVIEDGVYRILGRSSVDILKSGGHKISALEIEETLREHPKISECAVVGVADAEWGERVAAAVVLCSGANLDLDTLRAWAKERLSTHKVPSRLVTVEALPRNAMGKVTKPEVKKLFE